VLSCEDGRYTLRVPKAETARITERLLADLPVVDLLVEDPPIEEVIDRRLTVNGTHENLVQLYLQQLKPLLPRCSQYRAALAFG